MGLCWKHNGTTVALRVHGPARCFTGEWRPLQHVLKIHADFLVSARSRSVRTRHVGRWVEDEVWGWVGSAGRADARRPGLEDRVWSPAAGEKSAEEPFALRYHSQHCHTNVTPALQPRSVLIQRPFSLTVGTQRRDQSSVADVQWVWSSELMQMVL